MDGVFSRRMIHRSLILFHEGSLDGFPLRVFIWTFFPGSIPSQTRA